MIKANKSNNNKDYIKIEEIKMYLSTELLCKDLWDNEDYLLHGISNNEPILVDDNEVFVVELNQIKPFIKSLSNITDEEWLDIFSVGNGCSSNMTAHKIVRTNDSIALFFMTASIPRLGIWEETVIQNRFKDGKFYVSNGIFDTYEAYNKLATYHADIFNWIGRGLATEKEGLICK